MPKGDNQPHAKCSPETFVELFESIGPSATAIKLGTSERRIYERRATMEKRLGRQLIAPEHSAVRNRTRVGISHPQSLEFNVRDGVVLIGSDAHFWPHIVSTAYRAFLKFTEEMQPKLIIMNGDMIDGAAISRFPPMNWEQRPSVVQEIETTQERLGAIQKAAPNAKRIWNLGNHDSRFEVRLATVAPEYARVNGFTLKDHFPYWQPSWSTLINKNIMVKHRYKGGDHARHNNTLRAGMTMVTGHLHGLGVTPYTDYQGTRWGVDTGTMADPHGPQFEYAEHNPLNHRSGFAMLTFEDGELRWPELIHVTEDGVVDFRGKAIRV